MKRLGVTIIILVLASLLACSSISLADDDTLDFEGIPEDFNPHFVADKTTVEVGETVTFTNLTTGGTLPYTRAAWDFDADGIADIVIEGTEAEVMADVTHTYTALGDYSVTLYMRDSTPYTRWETRWQYIKVVIPDDATLDFEASKTELEIGEMTTFTITECPGVEPYKAEWDFDADGEIDVTVVGTKNQIMLPVNWFYNYDCGFFSVILTVTDSTSTTFREEKIDYIYIMCCFEVIPGDANGDGVVDALDITYLERIIAGLEDETIGADANMDGVVNSLDITWIERIIAGLV